MNNSDTLKKLIRIWAILWNTDAKTAMCKIMKDLHLDSLKEETNQKTAIVYMRTMLERKE